MIDHTNWKMSSKDPDIDAAHTKDSTGHGLIDEKKVVSEKRYIIPSRESIRMMAEAEGVTNLTDDGALILSEDLSYRLREIVQNSLEYMKHAKRRRLTTEDINDALRTSDMQPILGHGSPEPVTFKQVKDADIHFIEDVDLSVANIASNSYKPKETGELGIKSFWYAIEGVSKIIPVPAAAGETWKTPSFGQNKPAIVKKEKKELSENMLRYYDYMVKAILGADEEAMKFALSDLKTNSKIVPLLPYFVNFVSNGVKTVSHDISQLTRLLHTVKALTNNSNLYLEPEPYLGLLVQSVMYCGLEPLAASINPLNDHWVLRDYAARLLGHIVKKWSVHNSALMQNTLKSLKEVICDLSKPFCSHYGAVMGLLALGTKAIENVLLPELQTYMQHLTNFLEDTSLTNALLRTDANKVSGAILLAAEYVMKNLLENIDLQTPSPNSCCPKQTILSPSFSSDKIEPESSLNLEQITNVNADILKQRTAKEIYSELYDYFGDMLSSKLPIMELPIMELPIMELQHIYEVKKPEKLVKLYETNLSGEHLWNSMHARFVAEIAREHEEEERLEKEQRRERERLEREQRERELLEKERLKKEQAENAEKQQKRYENEKFWQPVQTEYEAEDSDNANDVDNMESSDNTNSEEDDEDESEEEEMEEEEEEDEEEEDEEEEDEEEEEEEEEESDDDTDSDKETLAVARTVTNPEAGIKLVITKIPQKVHIHKGEKDSKGKSETSQRTDRHKECKVSKKKKQNERSNKYDSRMYCKEDESSANGRKLTIRLRRSENPQNPKTNSR